MTKLPEIQFVAADWDAIRSFSGTLVAFASYDGTPNKIARELDRLCGGCIKRILADQDAKKNDRQRIGVIGYPDGCAAKSLIIARLPEEASPAGLRRLGVIIGKRSENAGVSLLAGNLDGIGELALGFALGRYSFDRHKSDEQADETETGPITLIVDDPKSARASFGDFAAVAEGVYSARDFVNEPANVLTTVEFASRLSEYRSLGISVSILDEDDLRKIGMRTLLAVGQGSDSPSRVAILGMEGSFCADPRIDRKGRGIRHGRNFDQALFRDGRNDDGHGRRCKPLPES